MSLLMVLLLLQDQVVETKVAGKLTSEYSGDYPFSYEGRAVLTADALKSLGAEGKVAEAAATKLARAFAEPEPEKEKKADEDPKTIDEISDVAFEVKEGALKGSFKIVRKEGPGTRTIAAEVSAKLDGGKLVLKLEKAKVTGTWDWGGGTAELTGKLETMEGASRPAKRREY